MSIRPEYQNFLTANGLFLLDQLPVNIQPIAIQNILNSEHTVFLREVKSARAAIKRNIHACINDRDFIRGIYSKRNKLKCPKYCKDYITSNLCEFKADGTYHHYYPL